MGKLMGEMMKVFARDSLTTCMLFLFGRNNKFHRLQKKDWHYIFPEIIKELPLKGFIKGRPDLEWAYEYFKLKPIFTNSIL